MQKKMFYLGLGVGCLLATSCVPESENALSDVKTAVEDAALNDLWSARHDNGDIQYLHIGAAARDAATEQPRGLMQMCLVTHRAQAKELAPPFSPRFFITRIGDASYANVLIEQGDQGKLKHLFYKYAAEGNRLTVWSMDWQETARVMEAEKLRGTVVRDGKGQLEKVLITDSTKNLQSFLRTGGDRIVFPDAGKTVYTRVGP